MIRNLILDWSGTLADDLDPVIRATNAIFREYGKREMTRDEFRRIFRLPFWGFWTETLPEASHEGLEQLYHHFFLKFQDDVRLLPGALDFLTFCSGTNRRMFLLSTIKREHFAAQSARLGVADFFEKAYVQIYDKREQIRTLLEAHLLDPAETAFVGDMVHDIETAKHGGVLSIAVTTGFDSIEKLLPAEPDVIVAELRHLRVLLG